METKIKLPQSWDEVTIGQWQEIDKIQADNEISKYIETLSILADVDPEEFRQLSIPEYREVQEQTKFLGLPLKNEVKIKFELNGVKYGMIPHLDFITAGEWMDAEVWKDKPADNLHLYCALLFRPITKETEDDYEIEKHIPAGFQKRAELFKDLLPITTVYGTILFFSTLGIECMKSLADYLEVDMKRMEKEMTSKTKTIQTHTRVKKQPRSKKPGRGII